MPKTVAIIGAGVAGIGSAKCCLEAGLNVVVFEKTNYIGGLWNYHEDIDENGIASVMYSSVINTSKEVSSFSDFPPPKENPNYMSHFLNVSCLKCINIIQLMFGQLPLLRLPTTKTTHRVSTFARTFAFATK